MAWAPIVAAAIPVIAGMLSKKSDASRISGGQAAGQSILRDILGRQGSDFGAGPFFHFSGANRTQGGLTDAQYAQLTPQFAKAAAMAQLLGMNAASTGVSTAALEDQRQSEQDQAAAAAIAALIAQLGQNKGNVDPGPSTPAQAGGSVGFGGGGFA
jgi:hypothetical protein